VGERKKEKMEKILKRIPRSAGKRIECPEIEE
jgi:hypothetical protein